MDKTELGIIIAIINLIINILKFLNDKNKKWWTFSSLPLCLSMF